jgi:hypothetical protein
VALRSEEIRANLSRFAAHWTLYKGSERSEAQTFLNELLACYGTDRREAGAIFEAPQEGRFLDLLWPGVCIVEMKAPAESKRLSHHRKQALDYWRDSADAQRGIPADADTDGYRERRKHHACTGREHLSSPHSEHPPIPMGTLPRAVRGRADR